MKRILLLLIFAIALKSSIAQQITLPPVSTLKTQADLDRTKADLIRAADWLEKNRIDKQKEKRKVVERFVFMWISASKKFNVDMNQKILALDEKNPGLIMIYTASATRYLVQNNRPSTTLEAQIAGLETIASVYRKGNGIKKDKKMEALLLAQQKGRVKEWILE